MPYRERKNYFNAVVVNKSLINEGKIVNFLEKRYLPNKIILMARKLIREIHPLLKVRHLLTSEREK